MVVRVQDARLDDNDPLDADCVEQPARGRSFRRGVVALRHEPREVVRTEDVEMRVGRAGRQATTQWPQRPDVGRAVPQLHPHGGRASV